MNDAGLGKRIRRARERARLTQLQLADAIGVDRKTVGNWESGLSSPRRSLGTLEAVLGRFGFSADYAAAEAAPPVPPPAADAVVKMVLDVLDSPFSPGVQVQMIRDIIERDYQARRSTGGHLADVA